MPLPTLLVSLGYTSVAMMLRDPHTRIMHYLE